MFATCGEITRRDGAHRSQRLSCTHYIKDVMSWLQCEQGIIIVYVICSIKFKFKFGLQQSTDKTMTIMTCNITQNTAIQQKNCLWVSTNITSEEKDGKNNLHHLLCCWSLLAQCFWAMWWDLIQSQCKYEDTCKVCITCTRTKLGNALKWTTSPFPNTTASRPHGSYCPI